jgi:hypothetical protein
MTTSGSARSRCNGTKNERLHEPEPNIRNGGAKKVIQQYFAYVVDSISRLSISCISRNRQLKVERMLVLFNLGVDTT